MCSSKNRFVHLLGMHWIFGSRKYMPHRTAPHSSVQVSPLPQLSSLHCVMLRSIILLRVRSNNTAKRKVYVTLVYLLLFAVELLCCEISFTDLLSAMICSQSLIIHVNLMFLYTESSFLFISHWFTRSDEHYYTIISLYEWMTETLVSCLSFSYEQMLEVKLHNV